MKYFLERKLLVKIYSTYSVKIKHYNKIFKDTAKLYRQAVDFLINVCLNEWDDIKQIEKSLEKRAYIEKVSHRTKDRPFVKYDFDSSFYKFPSYLRRAAIAEAFGKVSSYKSNLANWELNKNGKEPSVPCAGNIYPCLYRKDTYVRLDTYEAQIKVFRNNTWDWIKISLNKGDVDYILHHCALRTECCPILQKRGKEWFLDFPFEEDVKLNDTDVFARKIVAVDLGINTPATISVMQSDGTILGRFFCKLPKEQDSLLHSVNRIKKAQQNGNCKTPRLWVRAKGINKNISSKSAQYIIDVAVLYDADVIVFEHLDFNGKKKGSKKQRLHLWRSQEVQRIVTDKAHRLGMRVSHVNAWKTSKLAYDGSGEVVRGLKTGHPTNELCTFQNGKIYNCDLSASYNIGARYFIREILKSLPAKARLQLEAKVPSVCKRSTCTFSTLMSMNAALVA